MKFPFACVSLLLAPAGVVSQPTNCTAEFTGTRPAVGDVNGPAFQRLINACLNNDDTNCPQNFRVSNGDGDINCWSTELVTDMQAAFNNQVEFNEPLVCRNTSRVTRMDNMFAGATSFNQRIDDWNTTAVMNMNSMFDFASSFNQHIDSWGVSQATNMLAMFGDAASFNQPIDTWVPSSVFSMRQMFIGASYFNQCLSTWAENTPVDVDTERMFFGSSCPGINTPEPNLGPWCQGATENCIVPTDEPTNYA